MMTTRAAIVVALLFAGSAHAQVYKCQEGGKIVYAQAPCAGAGEAMRPGQLSGNSVGRAAPTTRSGSTTPAAAPPAAASTGQTQSCPTEQDIRNLETSASSIHLKAEDRRLIHMDIERARQCKPLLTDAQKVAEKDEHARKQRLLNPTYACDESGCWDSNRVRFNRAAPGFDSFWREDGKYCQLFGGKMTCRD